MTDSAYETQLRRRAFEPESRDWETTKLAVIAARGAREGVIDEHGNLCWTEYLTREEVAERYPEALARYEDRFGGVGDER